MPTSHVQLKQENIIEIARNTLKPSGWRCEWVSGVSNSQNVCGIVLGCWSAYLKHLLHHAHIHHKKTTKWECRLPRCNLPLRGCSTFVDLKSHIENSHMSRIPIYCPIRGCEGTGSFTRHVQLEGHFMTTHCDLLNKIVDLPSEVLLPGYGPFHPPTSNPIPPLPVRIFAGTAIIPPVKSVRRHALGSNRVEAQPPPASPKKRMRLNNLSTLRDPATELPSITFDNLEEQRDDDGEYIGNVGLSCVLGRKVEFTTDLARPQEILDPLSFGLRTPPVSILYGAFSKHLEEMEQAEVKVAFEGTTESASNILP
ncbi:hypothetical protein B0H34DRAFT_704880 [Crassisporium funariophilum]|nr:hypothetical protein B0H34DRAFT_704880 [Crassisporium funariophilum]